MGSSHKKIRAHRNQQYADIQNEWNQVGEHLAEKDSQRNDYKTNGVLDRFVSKKEGNLDVNAFFHP
jgi:hypothetical protein